MIMPQRTANNRVLLLDTNHPLLEERLQQAGFQCHYFPDLTPERLKEIIGEYAGIVVRSRFHLDRELLSCAASLSFIGRVGAGMEGIDTLYAEDRGIRCFNAPEGNRVAVGEHALGMLLALMNRMLPADREVRQGLWRREENRGNEITGKTVAIIGYGNTGSAFAGALSGFECRVIAYDKYKEGFSNGHVEEAGMDEVFSEADILSLHVPLTAETHFLVDGDFLSRFSKPLWLVNTARGKVVDTASLLKSLESGKVLGAALDVLEYENHSFEHIEHENLPEAYRKLASSGNVILTPHVAGWTKESKIKLAEVLVKKILDEFEPPKIG